MLGGLRIELPVPRPGPRQLGSLAGEVRVPDDFDDHLPEGLLAAFEGIYARDDTTGSLVKVDELIRLMERDG